MKAISGLVPIARYDSDPRIDRYQLLSVAGDPGSVISSLRLAIMGVATCDVVKPLEASIDAVRECCDRRIPPAVLSTLIPTI